jgi:arginyl-tRNA synthetase
MKDDIRALVQRALDAACTQGLLRPAGPIDSIPVEIDHTKFDTHGDFFTNIAMVSAKLFRSAPRTIAQALVECLPPTNSLLEKVEIAGPGFVNFFIAPRAWGQVVAQIYQQGQVYGASKLGSGQRVQVEFVSANPTGPLHVGHGRGAAVGDALANILAFSGYNVQREYYINDSGRQINTLGRSVYLRAVEISGQVVAFPDECYQGQYIYDLARELLASERAAILERPEEEAVTYCARFAAEAILAGIHSDLAAFGVNYDKWFSEQSLYDQKKVEETLADLAARGIVYDHEGARWFKTTDHGDEKDRVVVRGNGLTTYFASDIAYHYDKFQRGFERIIDVWGADHHGYISRVKAAIAAGGYDPAGFDVILVHLVNLLRKGEPVAMSTRSGEFVTLKAVVDEVGADAARFIFLSRDHDSPLDFDLELAKEKSNDNPVYYVQYVHARISSIARKAADKGIEPLPWHRRMADVLTTAEDVRLIKMLALYPEAVAQATHKLEPHRVTFYLMELAAAFHAYYNHQRVLTEEVDIAQARLCLVGAVKLVIQNGLGLLGISAPEKM